MGKGRKDKLTYYVQLKEWGGGGGGGHNICTHV